MLSSEILSLRHSIQPVVEVVVGTGSTLMLESLSNAEEVTGYN